GYDTHGLAEFAADNFMPSKILDIFDGFFISDTDQADGSGSNDIPELSLHADINAYAALNIVVASAGVGGGIDANVTFNLHDPDTDAMHPNGDGKVRIKEIIDDFQMGPLCLFDVAGKLTAGLNAFVKVGVDVPFV